MTEFLDEAILRSPAPTRKRKAAYLQMLAERGRLAAALTRHLRLLGLERLEKTPTLVEYLATREPQPEPAEPDVNAEPEEQSECDG